jgi:acid stress chaperone HdeB
VERRGITVNGASPTPASMLKMVRPVKPGDQKMKFARSILIAATLMLPCAGANAASVDLYTMNCKAFLDADKEVVLMILAWLDGWYKGDSDEAKFDPDEFAENTKKIAGH